MKKYYTATISEELLKAIIAKGYPHNKVSLPTYAEVLDWLIGNEIEINIFKQSDKWRSSIPGDSVEDISFTKCLDKAILLILELYDYDI